MKKMHIWSNYMDGKIFCGNKGRGLGRAVMTINLWAVKESALCKKCLKANDKAEKKG